MARGYERLLNMAVDVGYILLANGAEIYRVEESIQRILYAYGVKDAEVFAIPSLIIVSISTEHDEIITTNKRCFNRRINFDKVEKANDLCRRICEEQPDFAWVNKQLAEIEGRYVYSLPLLMLGYVVCVWGFTLFFGGNFKDSICSAVAGVIVCLIVTSMERLQVNSFFTNILASGFVSFWARICVHLGWAANMDKMIIGTLMILVPGVAITNSMRDIIAGDLIAGLFKMTEALIVATAIAVGTGGAIVLFHSIWGV